MFLLRCLKVKVKGAREEITYGCTLLLGGRSSLSFGQTLKSIIIQPLHDGHELPSAGLTVWQSKMHVRENMAMVHSTCKLQISQETL